MKKVIILRYSEIYLKGNNRYYFEKKLFNNALSKLDDINCKLERVGSRYIVSDYELEDEDEIISRMTKVFGFHSLSKGIETTSEIENIVSALDYFDFSNCTFRVSTNRADKTLPLTSTQISAEIGGKILEKFSNAKVDLHNYQKELFIDLRETKQAYLFSDFIDCAGGMPTGTAGNAMVLLSGGIDSPVSLYKVARRGAKIYVVHFHSYPYTSEQAKQKVIDLAKICASYCGKIKAFFVPFTRIQEEIHRNCNDNYMITLMRRIMMRIAEKLCFEYNCKAIVTGESLGQVASQTMESIISSNSVVKLPVYRPLIGDDKEDIIKVAKKIDTFATSILPYEDCCTVFLPKNPIIKPNLTTVKREESKLNIDELIENAMSKIEIMEIE